MRLDSGSSDVKLSLLINSILNSKVSVTMRQYSDLAPYLNQPKLETKQSVDLAEET